MTDEERKALEELEGPVKSLTPKPLIEMSDAELAAFVSGLRACTTQYQTMIAYTRMGKVEKPDVNEDLFD